MGLNEIQGYTGVSKAQNDVSYGIDIFCHTYTYM